MHGLFRLQSWDTWTPDYDGVLSKLSQSPVASMICQARRRSSQLLPADLLEVIVR